MKDVFQECLVWATISLKSYLLCFKTLTCFPGNHRESPYINVLQFLAMSTNLFFFFYSIKFIWHLDLTQQLFLLVVMVLRHLYWFPFRVLLWEWCYYLAVACSIIAYCISSLWVFQKCVISYRFDVRQSREVIFHTTNSVCFGEVITFIWRSAVDLTCFYHHFWNTWSLLQNWLYFSGMFFF